MELLGAGGARDVSGEMFGCLEPAQGAAGGAGWGGGLGARPCCRTPPAPMCQPRGAQPGAASLIPEFSAPVSPEPGCAPRPPPPGQPAPAPALPPSRDGGHHRNPSPDRDTSPGSVQNIYLYSKKVGGGSVRAGVPPRPQPEPSPCPGRAAGSKAGGPGRGDGGLCRRGHCQNELCRSQLIPAGLSPYPSFFSFFFLYSSFFYLYLFWHRKINRSSFGTSPSCESAGPGGQRSGPYPGKGVREPHWAPSRGARSEPCGHPGGLAMPGQG